MTQFDPLWDTDLGSPEGSVLLGRLRDATVVTSLRGHVARRHRRHTPGRSWSRPTGDHTVTVELQRRRHVRTPSSCTVRRDGSTTTCQVTVHACRWARRVRTTITATDAPESGSSRRYRHDLGRGEPTSVDDHRLVRNARHRSRRRRTAPRRCATPAAERPSAPTGEVTFSAVGAGAFGSPTLRVGARLGVGLQLFGLVHADDLEADHADDGHLPGGDADHWRAPRRQRSITVEPDDRDRRRRPRWSRSSLRPMGRRSGRDARSGSWPRRRTKSA